MSRFVHIVDVVFQEILSFLCVILFMIMMMAVLGQVVFRYGFNAPVSWSEELARYVMIWLAMLGSALAMRRGQHILLGDLLPMPERVRVIVRGICAAVVIAMLFVLVWQAWTLVERTARQITPGLALPMNWIYAAVPIGCVLMIVGLLLGWTEKPSQEPSQPSDIPAES